MKKVVASWSGGIDSTAVIAQLALRGYDIKAVVIDIYGESMPKFARREQDARLTLLEPLSQCAKQGGGSIDVVIKRGEWIWAFSPDGIEIPRRNKHIVDHLIMTEMLPHGLTNIALGEYTGADTWLVRDHVACSDADHRAIAAYLYLEYGISYRLISLQDFGESRYKSDRLRIGLQAIGDAMRWTTNCLADSELHCGKCYKCIERAAAYFTLSQNDRTDYLVNPKTDARFELYCRQMAGENVVSRYK